MLIHQYDWQRSSFIDSLNIILIFHVGTYARHKTVIIIINSENSKAESHWIRVKSEYGHHDYWAWSKNGLHVASADNNAHNLPSHTLLITRLFKLLSPKPTAYLYLWVWLLECVVISHNYNKQHSVLQNVLNM